MSLIREVRKALGSSVVGWSALLLFLMSLVNFLVFISLATYGFFKGVATPFPLWFNHAVDICLRLTLVASAISVIGLFFSRARICSVLALGTNVLCILLMAFLLTKG